MGYSDFKSPYGFLKDVESENRGNYKVFIPGKLPPPTDFFSNKKLQRTLYDATTAISKLSGICTQLPNPDMLVVPYMKREAVLSSQIEGTRISLSELLMSSAKNEEESNDVREVVNYILAIRYGLGKIEDGERIDLELIKKMHKLLMRGVRGYDRRPGEFRNIQNWVGPPTSDIQDATFVPPDPGSIENLMADLVEYINNSDALEIPLIKCAMIHYQFETIHPFCDGNGRIGRALITLYLCRSRIIEKPIMYLSGFFNEYKREYNSLLLGANMNSDFLAWTSFFLEAIKVQASEAMLTARKLQNLREQYRDEMQSISLTTNYIKTVDSLFVNPYKNIRTVSKDLGVSYPTAKKIVDKLIDMGILELAESKGRGNIFVAKKILSLIDDRK